MQEHTQICKELDGTLCALDSLRGRLQQLAEFCEATSRAEQGPSCRALLLRLAGQCASVASADAPSTPSRACQVRDIPIVSIVSVYSHDSGTVNRS